MPMSSKWSPSCTSPVSHARHMPRPSHISLLNSNNYYVRQSDMTTARRIRLMRSNYLQANEFHASGVQNRKGRFGFWLASQTRTRRTTQEFWRTMFHMQFNSGSHSYMLLRTLKCGGSNTWYGKLLSAHPVVTNVN
jgi:hypothetical protein